MHVFSEKFKYTELLEIICSYVSFHHQADHHVTAFVSLAVFVIASDGGQAPLCFGSRQWMAVLVSTINVQESFPWISHQPFSAFEFEYSYKI